ncbi:MAG TPA: hypothetical protein VFE05_00435 [Longimicrobiaceae bacterium]|jgi:hypothetical protein|nr:hypothetical protein [Longimicrobiaceae bacterium]
MPTDPIVFKPRLKINAHDLRRAADAAESIRGPEGKPMYVAASAEGGLEIYSEPPEGGYLFEVDTFEQGVGRPHPTAVIVVDCHGQTMDLAHGYDAVFWSEAAVEKFLLPYYASKSMWDAAAALKNLSQKWYGKVPDDGDDDGDDATPVDGATLPFAVAHMPDSEYQMQSPNSSIHVLWSDGNGVIATPVPEPVPSPALAAVATA